MLFNSLEFLVFFVGVTGLYYALPWRWRWKMLLAASCVFYMAFVPVYILILGTTILIDWWMGMRIEASQDPAWRKVLLVVSILSTCAVLFVFKYFDFFASTVNQVQGWLGLAPSLPLAGLLLPIGLSFHTFQSLSYVVEVYRGKQKAEHNLGIYSLYVMFYPQLVAGPIERPQNLLHQFYVEHRFDLRTVAPGLLMITWGFFKKMVISDRASEYVDMVYGPTWSNQPSLALLVATLLFAVQIYADFSGYSSIAIGCAQVMGFKLMRNFRHPYFASGVSDFWARWHISLSTWFKDYVYIPLGGNRVSVPRHALNLLLTFTLSGLWHGANWTFLAWGAWNGVLLVVEHHLAPLLRTRALTRWLNRVVFVSAVVLGWVFFRARSMEQALGIYERLFFHWKLDLATLQHTVLQFTGDNTSLGVGLVTLGLIGGMFVAEYLAETRDLTRRFFRRDSPLVLVGAATVVLVQVILLFGVLRSSSFIYFQF